MRYNVNIANAQVAADEAYRRMAQRYIASGRLINGSYLDQVGDRPSQRCAAMSSREDWRMAARGSTPTDHKDQPQGSSTEEIHKSLRQLNPDEIDWMHMKMMFDAMKAGAKLDEADKGGVTKQDQIKRDNNDK